ncbi:MAG: hypothetical protein AAF907_05350, partial [Planctomycetota bacterium]
SEGEVVRHRGRLGKAESERESASRLILPGIAGSPHARRGRGALDAASDRRIPSFPFSPPVRIAG